MKIFSEEYNSLDSETKKRKALRFSSIYFPQISVRFQMRKFLEFYTGKSEKKGTKEIDEDKVDTFYQDFY